LRLLNSMLRSSSLLFNARELFAQTSPSLWFRLLATAGAFTHQDFAGHKGTIRIGDVQWMTAGRGIVHSEMPAGDGVHKGLQLWINLSSKYKMIEPRYQELEHKDISRGESENGGVEALGVATPVYTHPHHVCGLHHAPRVSPAPARPGGLECLHLRRRRRGRETATAHYCLVLAPGDGVNVWNRSTRPLRFVLVTGQPLGVPVVQHRPFVMNSHVEIQKAMEDYYYGKNDFERAGQWSSFA
jgi:quercetin 2,3-dioxygenase